MAWGKLGSATATSTVNSLDSSTYTGNESQQIFYHDFQGTGGNMESLKFNDSGTATVYAFRGSRNNGSDSTSVTQNNIQTNDSAFNHSFAVIYVCAVVGKDKLIIGREFDGNNTMGDPYTNRHDFVGKFVPATDAPITKIALDSVDGNRTYISGSNITILGSDFTNSPLPTNVQAGSRFEETDTRKMYHYELSGGATYTPTIETADWTLTDNGGSATIANNELTIVANSNGDNPIATYDLGATISDTQWLMTFQVVYSGFQNSASGNGTKLGIGIGSSSSTTDLAGWNTSGMSFIEYDFRGHASTSVWQPYVSGGNSSGRTETAGVNTPDGGGYSATQYVKLYRLTSTTGKMEFYLQSDYSDTPVTLNVTMANVPSGLRYVFARSEYENVPDTNTFVISNFKIYNATNTVTTAANAWTEEGT